MMRTVLILLLLCSPALAHDAGHPELNEWFNRLASGRGYAVLSRTALLSAMLIGNRRMAITASVSRADGSTFPTTPWSPSRTAPAERWCGRCGLTAKPLSGASCPAAWPRARGSGPRSHRRCRPHARRFNPADFSFGFGGFGKLLLLRLALGRRWRSRPTKSGGPPLFEPSLKVQGDDTHNNSGFSVI
jgi:hypothetical protein